MPGALVLPQLPQDADVDRVVAVVVHCAAFLELSGEKVVDTEWARRSMAAVTRRTRGMPPEEVDQLRGQLKAVARFARKGSISAGFLAFVDGLLARGPLPSSG
ncbi:MAG: hypothetical protein AB2A00_14690 [Myxococcota bacterium]